MGFCLYGNDIDKTTNPIEAGLGWITKVKKGDFIGSDALLKIKDNGVNRKLVAIVADSRAFPRHGYEITDNGSNIGTITSGTLSPILGKPIAMGYVDKEYSDVDSIINIKIRNKDVEGLIVKLPFVSL